MITIHRPHSALPASFLAPAGTAAWPDFRPVAPDRNSLFCLQPGQTVVIAPDKFKGTLDAANVRRIIKETLLEIQPNLTIIEIPMADGGEGTVEAALTSAVLRHAGTIQDYQRFTSVTGPLPEVGKVDARWAMMPGGIAVLEMAAAAGLVLCGATRKPYEATTYGVGELILAAQAAGAKQIFVGLGGSATNDGGLGMAQALGWKFDPVTFQIQSRPSSLSIPILAACDVKNPLAGPQGCIRVFGPQKGIERSEEAYRPFDDRLAALAGQFDSSYATTEGAGAAGGLGFGMMVFANGRIVSGFSTVAELVGLEEAIRGADLVITGEGSLDSQTLNGKGPHGVAQMATRLQKPAIAIAGGISEGFESETGAEAFSAALQVTPPEAILRRDFSNAEACLRAAIKEHFWTT